MKGAGRSETREFIRAATALTALHWYDSLRAPRDCFWIHSGHSHSWPVRWLGGRDHSFVKTEHDQICQEISGELQDMARWLSGGDLSPEQFRLGLTRIEDRKLKRFGLKLSSTASEDRIVHFSLRFADTEDLCASMDVDPATGKLTVQPACRAVQ